LGRHFDRVSERPDLQLSIDANRLAVNVTLSATKRFKPDVSNSIRRVQIARKRRLQSRELPIND